MSATARSATAAAVSAHCAGGPTPWGTWLTCEEVPDGRVWECTVEGGTPARVLPALGRFNHEAVAVDPVNRHLYLTEDRPDGAFFRFVPSASDWPAAAARPAASPFNGGEGLWFHAGQGYFSTKGDNRVWRYDTAASTLAVVYDDTMAGGGLLTGVDSLVGNVADDILVAEDGGDQQIVAITTGSTRFYFGSQRGPGVGLCQGVTYEVRGAFVLACNEGRASAVARSPNGP